MVACSNSHHTQFFNVFLFVSVSQTHLQACQESFLGPTNMLLMYFFSLAAAVLCCASSKQKPTTLTKPPLFQRNRLTGGAAAISLLKVMQQLIHVPQLFSVVLLFQDWFWYLYIPSTSVVVSFEIYNGEFNGEGI